MQDNPYRESQDELKELLRQYENLRNGRRHSFLEEESFERIIDYFDETENLTKALEVAETGLEYFPFSAQLLIRKADILIATRKYTEALPLLQQAELFDSSDINIYILKTDIFLALDQQEKAVALLEDALNMFEGEDKIELLFELADVYDDYEEFDKVFECMKLLLEQEPANEEALYKICFWTDFTGRNEESIKLHLKIINELPYSELAWFNLGSAYQGLKLYEKAIDAYQYAIAIDDKFDYAYRNIGDAYIRLRKYKEAIEILEKICEFSRPEEVIYEAIGHCYYRLKKTAQARFNYRKASHMNPDDSKLYYKVALTYMDEQHWTNAVKQLESAMRIHKHLPEYNMAMGKCFMQLEKFKEAAEYLGLAVNHRPKNLTGWELLIKCLYTANDFDTALHQCRLALEYTGKKPIFYFLQAAVLFTAAKSKEAILQLELGLSIAPRKVKEMIELNPSVLQNPQVVDILAKYKKGKKI